MKRYFLDLFSGIGGFALGAEWAGLRFDGHFFSEVDPYAIRVYERQFPGAVGLGDIRGICGADLPEGEWITAGGFPCQDISVAGKGAGLAGERSGLWYEYARIIGELRPCYAIMENVGALAFRGLDSVLGSLAALGYDAEWQDIRASDVGAPHRRERIWIVAYPEQCEGGERHQPAMLGRWKDEAEQAGMGGDVGYPSGSGRGGLARRWAGAEPQAGHLQLEAGALADASSAGFQVWRQTGQPEGDTQAGTGVESESERCSQALAYPSRERSREARKLRRDESEEWATSSGQKVADSESIHVQGFNNRSWEIESRRGGWWATEPDVGRVAHGVPARVDRLRCLGNSIVPQIAELIFRQAAFDEWRVA